MASAANARGVLARAIVSIGVGVGVHVEVGLGAGVANTARGVGGLVAGALGASTGSLLIKYKPAAPNRAPANNPANAADTTVEGRWTGGGDSRCAAVARKR